MAVTVSITAARYARDSAGLVLHLRADKARRHMFGIPFRALASWCWAVPLDQDERGVVSELVVLVLEDCADETADDLFRFELV